MEQKDNQVTAEQKKRFELPFHIVKRSTLPLKKKILVYAIALVGSLLLSSLICWIFGDGNPLDFFAYLFKGTFGTSRKFWLLLLETAFLLGASVALIPAFKMKFWNLGGNGQILMGCLASYAFAYKLGGKMPEWVLLLLMFVSSVAAGILWAVIPAIFKAIFNTNETLFTLMMNYIAEGVVLCFFAYWIHGQDVAFPKPNGGVLPALGNNMLLTILVFFLLAGLMFVYLKYSKHGYEISVVGESVNTAKYIGIDVKKVIIRTLILSGAIAGLIGFFLIARTSAPLDKTLHNNMGFTGIMTSWLAAFNPLFMFLTCFFIAFINTGMSQVQTDFGFTNNAISKIVIGLIYFFVIACAFFINYKIVRRDDSGQKKPLKKRPQIRQRGTNK